MAQSKKKSMPASAPKASAKVSVARPLYFDSMREVLARGDLAEMKRVSAEARKQLEQSRQLEGALQDLDKAIEDMEG